MNIVKLSKKEYIELARELHSCSCLSSSNMSGALDYETRKKENEKIIKNFTTFNDEELPLFIDYHDATGVTRYTY